MNEPTNPPEFAIGDRVVTTFGEGIIERQDSVKDDAQPTGRSFLDRWGVRHDSHDASAYTDGLMCFHPSEMLKKRERES
jgi:hypothetical protein